MFVVDLLHEFELGVWKATFTHLMRILFAAGGDAIQILNRRYAFNVVCNTVPSLIGSDSVRSLHSVVTQSGVFTAMRQQ
jgi:hypothetical protein